MLRVSESFAELKCKQNFTNANFAISVKKAYYKQALKFHPDRVAEDEKENATEKFKVLAKVHEVLSDDNRRKLYDEQGIVDDDDDEKFGTSWMEAFKNIFKPISEDDIDNYRRGYIGSEIERGDVKKAYVNGEGCMNYLMEFVPFMAVEDEPRIIEIVKEMIAAGEVPEFQDFLNEPKRKRDRRHKKYAKEKLESEELKREIDAKKQKGEDDLFTAIAKRNEERGKGYNSFMDQLMAKYGNAEESEEEEDFDIEVAKKLQKGKKKPKSTPGKEKKETPIKSGRVSKRNSRNSK